MPTPLTRSVSIINTTITVDTPANLRGLSVGDLVMASAYTDGFNARPGYAEVRAIDLDNGTLRISNPLQAMCKDDYLFLAHRVPATTVVMK